MAKRKDFNNEIRRRNEEDQQFDKRIARSELEAFIVKIDEFGIQYDNVNNAEELWIKIDLKNISQEQKTSLMGLLNSVNVNFTIKKEETYITCYDQPIRNSY